MYVRLSGLELISTDLNQTLRSCIVKKGKGTPKISRNNSKITEQYLPSTMTSHVNYQSLVNYFTF